MYGSVRARSGLLGDFQNIYCVARAMILAKVLVRLSSLLFFSLPFAARVG